MGRFESPLAGSISTSFNNSVHDITSRMAVKTVSFAVSLPGFITQLFHVLLAYFVFSKMSDITYKMGLLWKLNKFIHIQQLQPGQSFGKCWKNAVLYFLACFEHAAIVFYRNFRNRVICMDLGTDCMQKMREREELLGDHPYSRTTGILVQASSFLGGLRSQLSIDSLLIPS